MKRYPQKYIIYLEYIHTHLDLFVQAFQTFYLPWIETHTHGQDKKKKLGLSPVLHNAGNRPPYFFRLQLIKLTLSVVQL